MTALLTGKIEVLQADGLTWRDITEHVQSGVTAVHGRQTVLQQAGPASLTFTLLDPDHRYIPGQGAYAAWWDQGALVQWTELVDGVTISHYQGYVQMPAPQMMWGELKGDGTESAHESYVDVSCVDYLTWLDRQGALTSTLATFLVGRAYVSGLFPSTKAKWGLLRLWTMGGAGSRQAELTAQGPSLFNPRPLPGAVTPQAGDPLPGDDLSPVLFALLPASNYGGVPIDSVLTTESESIVWPLVTNGALTVAFWVDYVGDFPAGLTVRPVEITSGAGDYVRVSYDGASHKWVAEASVNGATVTASLGPTPTDKWQMIAVQLRYSGGTALRLWVDSGVTTTSSWTGSPGTTVTFTAVTVGRGMSGAVAYVQVYVGDRTGFSDSEYRVQLDAGLNGFDRQLAGDRYGVLTRDVRGFSEGFALGDPTTLMSPARWAGKSRAAALQDVATAEGGQIFCGPDGPVSARNRAYRYGTAVPVTEVPYSWLRDGVQAQRTLTNAAAITQAGAGTTTYRDAASVLRYGEELYEATVDTVVDVDVEVLARFAVDYGKAPTMRLDQFAVDLDQLTEAQQHTLLAAVIGDRLHITGAPTYWPVSMTVLYLEGRSLTHDDQGRVLTMTASPVLGQAVDGAGHVLDAGQPTWFVLDTSALGGTDVLPY